MKPVLVCIYLCSNVFSTWPASRRAVAKAYFWLHLLVLDLKKIALHARNAEYNPKISCQPLMPPPFHLSYLTVFCCGYDEDKGPRDNSTDICFRLAIRSRFGLLCRTRSSNKLGCFNNS